MSGDPDASTIEITEYTEVTITNSLIAFSAPSMFLVVPKVISPSISFISEEL